MFLFLWLYFIFSVLTCNSYDQYFQGQFVSKNQYIKSYINFMYIINKNQLETKSRIIHLTISILFGRH